MSLINEAVISHTIKMTNTQKNIEDILSIRTTQKIIKSVNYIQNRNKRQYTDKIFL